MSKLKSSAISYEMLFHPDSFLLQPLIFSPSPGENSNERKAKRHAPFLGTALKWMGNCCCLELGPNHGIEMLLFTTIQAIRALRQPNMPFFHKVTQQTKQEEGMKTELHKHLSEAALLCRQKCSH